MKVLAALLILLVAAVHYGPDLLAYQYADPDSARKVIAYVGRAFEGAVQYALIALLALAIAAMHQREELSLWWGRAGELGRLKGSASAYVSTALVSLVCGWGIVEHLQVGACRLAIGIDRKVPAGQPLTGLCDGLTGLPMYALGLGVVAFIAAVIAAYSWERKDA